MLEQLTTKPTELLMNISLGYYDYSFYRMEEIIKTSVKNCSAVQKVDSTLQRSLFQIEDKETDLYADVADKSYSPLLHEIGMLMMRLFSLYGVDFIPVPEENSDLYPVCFYRIENEKKVGYLFSRSIFIDTYYYQQLPLRDHFDEIKVVALVDLGENSITRRQLLSHQYKHFDKPVVKATTIKELFSLINEKEYSVFLKYVRELNKKARKLIGYRTMIVPSEKALLSVKNDIVEEFFNGTYDSYLMKEGIFKSQIAKIKHNLFTRKMYKAIIGIAPFAESFISSEWYYRTHLDFSVLEQTAIIAGYLKSVEQLLYTLVQLSEGTGRKINRKEKTAEQNSCIDYCKSNESEIDFTLWSITKYVKTNPDLWDVNPFVKNYIVTKLNTYREKYRNDHLHKDNIHDVEEINEIRFNTLLLHYLLLGAMKIKDNEKSNIGILPEPSTSLAREDLTYNIFEKWLSLLMNSGISLPKTSVLFFSIGVIRDYYYYLRLETTTEISEKGFALAVDFPFMDVDLQWKSSDNKEEVVNKVIALINEYLDNSKDSSLIKQYPLITAGFGPFGPHAQILYKNDIYS